MENDPPPPAGPKLAEPPPEGQPVRESAKDGCSYSLDLTKQFITLASAGVAFVLGLASAEATRPPFLLVLSVLLAMTASVLFGLACHARITGLIAKSNRYDAYDPIYLKLAKVQLGSFASGFVLLAVFTLLGVWKGAKEETPPEILHIRHGESRITVPLSNAVEFRIQVASNAFKTITVK